jgi:hypothetical protein
MKRLRWIILAVLVLLSWRFCFPTETTLGFSRPREYANDRFIPAGDSSVRQPRIIRSNKPYMSEYASNTRVPHLRFEERWSVDSPHIATVERGGVIRTYTPGWVNATLRLRGFKRVLSIRVGPPLDSVVMRFAARTVMVGDTVELFYRRYYADGSEEVGLQWKPFPDERDRDGIPVGFRVIPELDAGNAIDTIRFWIRRPGAFRVRSTTHGRAPIFDSLLASTDLGRAPQLIRAPEWGRPQQPVPNRKPALCYALTFGTWTNDNFRVTRGNYAWLPAAVELDSTLLIAKRPDLGMRVNPTGSNRLEMARSWQRAGDSIVINFETRENRIPHQRVRIAFPVGRTEAWGRATDSAIETDVTARSVGCGDIVP